MSIQRAPVVGDPIDESVSVPSANEGLARLVDFIQASGDFEVSWKPGFAIRSPVIVRRKDWEWDERPRH